MPFENRGDEVGVTQHHPHGQIYAFPFVPKVQQDAVKAFAEGYNLSQDINRYKADYAVTEAGGLCAFCPPYARFPFETWIAPYKRHDGPWTFSEEKTPYMLSLHAAPKSAQGKFHFTAQFYPLLRSPERVKYLASVEQATGAFTVDVMPEMAAKTLRAL